MKNQALLLTVILAAFAAFSCEKEHIADVQPAQTTKTDDLTVRHEAGAILAGLQDSIYLGGLDFSDEAEYLALPQANPEAIQRLKSGKLVEQRDNWVWIETPPVANQGQEGSCVSFATAYAVVSYYLNTIYGLPYTKSSALRSPEFLYNMTKAPGDCGAGTNFDNAFEFLSTYGVCSWTDMPYTDAGCSTRPNNVQWMRASLGRIDSWRSVAKNANNIRSFIDNGYPVVAGITVDDWFLYQTDNSPYVWDTMGGEQHGGHAVAIIGYNDDYEVFLVQNSWGKGAHDGGYFYLSYDLVPYLNRLYVLNPVF